MTAEAAAEAAVAPTIAEQAPEEDVAKQHDDLDLGDVDEDADRSLMLSVWDFGGQTVFRALLDLFINRCSVFLVCFRLPDLAEEATTEEALDHVLFWMHAIEWYVRPTDPLFGS